MFIIKIIFSIISKIVKTAAELLSHILAWTGLWIPVVYTGIFFLAVLVSNPNWNDVQIAYFIGLAVCIGLALMWFTRRTLKIGKPKKEDPKN